MAETIGAVDSAHFDGGKNLNRGGKASSASPTLGDVLAGMQFTPVPSNIETAALTLGADNVREDWALVTALNLVLSADLPTGVRLVLLGTIETVNGEAAVNNLIFNHGGTLAAADDTDRTFATANAAASEFINGVFLFTDAAGAIVVAVDDVANLDLVFHLEGYAHIRTAVSS